MISIIVACDSNGGVGKDNAIPWLGKHPEDLKFFADKTKNNVVVMGNNTWLSLPPKSRPLPNRLNAVVTSSYNEEYHTGASTLILPHPTANIAARIESLDIIHEDKEIFVIGGPTLWNETINIVDKIYVTAIPGTYDCDVFFLDPLQHGFERTQILPLCQDCNEPIDVYVYERR
ncbi:dihydrofolate reductase [Vibrio phage 2.275.O._10N.286.54.E11]|nr:dihydrofolate reductase [Vibrio phage 2.275.O._10N.286.54.E11]